MKNHALIAAILITTGFLGCKVTFNFSGGNVPSDLETLFVDNFTNEAEIVVPYLALLVSEQLQDQFLNQSKLSLTSGSADVELSGAVVRYTVLPTAISGENRAEQNRMTIGIRVSFQNNKNPTESWEQNFSGFVDFDASEDLSNVERDKIEEVLEQITQDVFSKSLGKW
jgi:hypothetical protein